MGHTDEALLARIAESARAYLSTAIPRSAYCGWLVESPEGEVVAGAGILMAEWPGSPADPGATRAWILNVYTVPAWRRRGLARRLVTTATDWCRQHGLGFIALHASREGRRVYEALGFTPTNEMRLEL
jgi:GNAT superfamily N-acetyltransferase